MKRQPIALHISNMLKISEIFKSIQGESSRAGEVCGFIRLHGCNLACSFCDTVYARQGDYQTFSVDDAVRAVCAFDCSLVEVTGGEPLVQKDTPELCRGLIDNGKTVMVETNGTLDIGRLPAGCVRIVDVKCPGSGAGGSFLKDNVARLVPGDEIKFVVTSREDFEWAIGFMRENELLKKCAVFFSPAFEIVEPQLLARWILQSSWPVRMGLQMHKIIWGEQRGV